MCQRFILGGYRILNKYFLFIRKEYLKKTILSISIHSIMKKSTGRRSFLKKIGAGSASAALLPVAMPLQDTREEEKYSAKNVKVLRRYNDVYQGDFLKRVAFPIGGIGTGMFCLEGSGAISHMSVRGKPDVFNEPGTFAAICVK